MSKKKENVQEVKAQKKWSFPTASRCPRCGSTDTKAMHTDNKIGRQYRKCQRGICRWNYSVDGKEI